jgi:hypothetical protein
MIVLPPERGRHDRFYSKPPILADGAVPQSLTPLTPLSGAPHQRSRQCRLRQTPGRTRLPRTGPQGAAIRRTAARLADECSPPHRSRWSSTCGDGASTPPEPVSDPIDRPAPCVGSSTAGWARPCSDTRGFSASSTRVGLAIRLELGLGPATKPHRPRPGEVLQRGLPFVHFGQVSRGPAARALRPHQAYLTRCAQGDGSPGGGEARRQSHLARRCPGSWPTDRPAVGCTPQGSAAA